ncbi:lipid IV(A) 3-deoxy-D-manno-octulosonic acid transferase [soil metagenome]
MILYRALQPLLLAVFGVLANVLRLTPGLRAKTRKLWTTWDIRYVKGRPAFLGIDPILFGGAQPIWIHAASGEFEYAKPVIREIRERSAVPILVTYFSPTYAENVQKFPGVTASCPLPLDSRDELESFIQHLKPKALLIARTDAWPNTVTAAHDHQIPILLFSATFHDQSKRLRGFGKSLTRATLQKLSLIQCVTEEDREILSLIGVTKTVVAGDSRYDQVLARLATAPSVTVRGQLSSARKVIHDRALVAGSVWSEDLAPVVTASKATQERHPHTLIIVPHEISESFLREIEATCERLGFAKSRIARLSKLNAAYESALDVLIVDAIGLLAELYRLGEVAFVGGSFRKTVHSVMEPLAAGCLTIVGPLHSNNREAIEFQKERSTAYDIAYVTAVTDAAGFTTALTKAWTATETPGHKAAVADQVARRAGATAHVVRWLSEQKLIE